MAKILIIEDTENNRVLLTRRLKSRGYDIITAEDAEKGLLLVEVERPDLVRLHPAGAEVVEDRRLYVTVDAPAVAVGLGHADVTPVERADRFFSAHRTSWRIAAARSHCSCVGTSAKRT